MTKTRCWLLTAGQDPSMAKTPKAARCWPRLADSHTLPLTELPWEPQEYDCCGMPSKWPEKALFCARFLITSEGSALSQGVLGSNSPPLVCPPQVSGAAGIHGSAC